MLDRIIEKSHPNVVKKTYPAGMMTLVRRRSNCDRRAPIKIPVSEWDLHKDTANSTFCRTKDPTGGRLSRISSNTESRVDPALPIRLK